MRICIINGPNLNLTGKREPETYGIVSFDEFIPALKEEFPQVEIDYFQSNIEGELINRIQEAEFVCDGIVLNAGGYSHSSIAIGDAVKSVKVPVVEVHMTNIWRREEYRHRSYVSGAARGVIAGFGLSSYRLALISLMYQ
ncbi:MAG: 3-dehydroquinate dehydratase [Lentimicrobium sp.]|jgi:3-dehydroquinate dehydratase-2|nr:3-dehydroquinate dehydratase [Lentimicrobium sp.]MDD2526791.1 3-dehydroquinate dehydratase [Lentimicrobiaceae bacterium]MDD4596515.1 3-dehydroquinate dehydratase [Lentimicrobiaceae bacterium]MDY0024757.1 type II 3-dehydroquinate dehydratase [Lentimicrobium sp.]HAH58792.1 3-dehydroquinate dehydratase [Bacteroidales bacterium]